MATRKTRAQLEAEIQTLQAAQATAPQPGARDDRNSFILFMANSKPTPKSPDAWGYLTSPNGQKFRMACWLQQTSKGQRFVGKIQPQLESAPIVPKTETGGAS